MPLRHTLVDLHRLQTRSPTHSLTKGLWHGGVDRGLGTVLVNEKLGGAVDVEVGDQSLISHATAKDANARARGRTCALKGIRQFMLENGRHGGARRVAADRHGGARQPRCGCRGYIPSAVQTLRRPHAWQTQMTCTAFSIAASSKAGMVVILP